MNRKLCYGYLAVALAAAALFTSAGPATAQVIGSSAYNPWNGRVIQQVEGYNPYTGAYGRAGIGYSPFTGTYTSTRERYNPVLGRTLIQERAFNPYTCQW